MTAADLSLDRIGDRKRQADRVGDEVLDRIARLLAVAAALVGLASAAGCGGSGSSPVSAEGDRLSRPAQLQAALDSWAARPGHQGVSASVVFADGSQWTGVAGRAQGSVPLREEDLIWVASLTKTMTGAIVLQLADEGVLGLDDPVSRWLPARPNVDPTITLRQLLNHSNGLDNYTSSAALGAAIAAEPTRVLSADELLSFLGPPHFPPGVRTEYTNTAFVLLGQVAETVAARSIVDLYHRRLWDPLGLAGIFLPGFEPAPGAVAPALSAQGVVLPLDYPALVSTGNAAFGLMSNARTMARWGAALFTGTVVSARMQEEMRTLIPAAGNIAGESGAGLGIRGYQYLGRAQLGHSGGCPFGSSLLLHDPSTRVTVVVLMNQGQGADHFVLGPNLLDVATRP
jgi:D-alanyl-D-alanine carboxypeptidase